MDQVKEYAPIAQQVAGTVLQASGEYKSGRAQQNTANTQGTMAKAQGIAAEKLAILQARQLEQNAGQDIAAGTAAVDAERRKSELIASRAMAVAAASGAGALDPTVVKILQGIRGEGELAANTQMYNANERARGQTDQAAATRYEGKLSRIAGDASNAAYRSMGKAAAGAGRTKALTTVMSGLGKFAATWGGEDDTPPGLTPIGPDHTLDYYLSMNG